MELGKREITYLSLHCHHQNHSRIKMGSDENHFNVSLIVRDKATRQCPQTTFEEKGEPKQIRTEVLCLPALPLGQPGSHDGVHKPQLLKTEKGETKLGTKPTSSTCQPNTFTAGPTRLTLCLVLFECVRYFVTRGPGRGISNITVVTSNDVNTDKQCQQV